MTKFIYSCDECQSFLIIKNYLAVFTDFLQPQELYRQ